jgi:hypothetical protein
VKYFTSRNALTGTREFHVIGVNRFNQSVCLLLNQLHPREFSHFRRFPICHRKSINSSIFAKIPSFLSSTTLQLTAMVTTRTNASTAEEAARIARLDAELDKMVPDLTPSQHEEAFAASQCTQQPSASQPAVQPVVQ